MRNHLVGNWHCLIMGKVKNTEILCQMYRQNFFNPRNSTSSSETALSTLSVSAVKQSTTELHLEKPSAAKTEIIWTLKSVTSDYSGHSIEDMNETLAAMFPEFLRPLSRFK